VQSPALWSGWSSFSSYQGSRTRQPRLLLAYVNSDVKFKARMWKCEKKTTPWLVLTGRKERADCVCREGGKASLDLNGTPASWFPSSYRWGNWGLYKWWKQITLSQCALPWVLYCSPSHPFLPLRVSGYDKNCERRNKKREPSRSWDLSASFIKI
jgi:hypothetical protein